MLRLTCSSGINNADKDFIHISDAGNGVWFDTQMFDDESDAAEILLSYDSVRYLVNYLQSILATKEEK